VKNSCSASRNPSSIDRTHKRNAHVPRQRNQRPKGKTQPVGPSMPLASSPERSKLHPDASCKDNSIATKFYAPNQSRPVPMKGSERTCLGRDEDGGCCVQTPIFTSQTRETGWKQECKRLQENKSVVLPV
jgi:hypothetical protein